MQRRITLILVMLVSCWGTCLGQDFSTDLQSELIELGRVDQDVRNRMMARLGQSGSTFLSSDEFRSLAEEQASVDQANLARLEEIIRENGWPSPDLVGEEANGAAWIVMQHADIDRQRHYLPLLREAVEENRARASNLAMLEDEISLIEHDVQIYGTEIKLVDDRVFVAPVTDPERLDERRAAVGLPPMEEYLKQAEAEIGRPIDRTGLLID